MNPQHAIETLYATGKWLLDEGKSIQAADVFRVMMLVAPGDERSWLGIGACHEALLQAELAIDLYEKGEAAAQSGKCSIARARVFRMLGRDADADAALEAAEGIADAIDDDDLRALLAHERSVS